MQPACARCRSSTNLSLCGRCRGVHYCSTACQRSDWESHKARCKRRTIAPAVSLVFHERCVDSVPIPPGITLVSGSVVVDGETLGDISGGIIHRDFISQKGLPHPLRLLSQMAGEEVADDMYAVAERLFAWQGTSLNLELRTGHWVVPPVGSLDTINTGDVLVISTISVLPHGRHRGIGASLLTTLLRHPRAVHSLAVLCSATLGADDPPGLIDSSEDVKRATNIARQTALDGFWQAQGFRRLGPFMYARPSDSLHPARQSPPQPAAETQRVLDALYAAADRRAAAAAAARASGLSGERLSLRMASWDWQARQVAGGAGAASQIAADLAALRAAWPRAVQRCEERGVEPWRLLLIEWDRRDLRYENWTNPISGRRVEDAAGRSACWKAVYSVLGISTAAEAAALGVPAPPGLREYAHGGGPGAGSCLIS